MKSKLSATQIEKYFGMIFISQVLFVLFLVPALYTITAFKAKDVLKENTYRKIKGELKTTNTVVKYNTDAQENHEINKGMPDTLMPVI